MAPKHAALLLVLSLLGCNKTHSIYGSWTSKGDADNSIWTFHQDHSCTIEQPGMFVSVTGTYRLEDGALTVKTDKVMIGETSQVDKAPTTEIDIRWIDDDEFTATSNDDIFSGNEVHFTRMSAEEVAQAKAAGSALTADSQKVPALPPSGPGRAFSSGKALAQDMDEALCVNNERTLAGAIALYAQDFDEQLPDAMRWGTALGSYVKDQFAFSCPTLRAEGKKFGYAMSQRYSAEKLTSIVNPAQAILLFESKNLRANASDNGTSIPIPGRHHGVNNFGFLDGHVEPLK